MNALVDLLSLLLTIIIVLAAAYLPGYLAVRALRGTRPLALAAAPALGAALAGVSALAAAQLGMRWSLLPFLLGASLLVLGAWGLARVGILLPETALVERSSPRRRRPWVAIWLAGAIAVAIAPIAVQMRRPGAVLERWDTLYHLTALQRIRETGTASSLDLGSVSNTAGDATAYPAGFHALAALVPGIPTPIILNGAVLGLATVPWILGIALLAKTLYPKISWASSAAALVAVLIPATPLNLWVHLSPIPNLTGFAFLPGALAAGVALWGSLLPRMVALPGAPSSPFWKTAGPSLLLIAVAGLGLGLLHPNVAVTALILLTILTAMTGAPHMRGRPVLALIPIAAAAPVIVLHTTPLGSTVTGFVGGLQVPLWTALGEIVLGLHTVWPMALGVVIAALWWPGLVASFRSPERWIGVAWAGFAVLYLDAAVDSPLDLSALFYRGQDRLSMPLAMLSAVLVIPGLQRWARVLRRRAADGSRAPLALPVAIALVVFACAAALTSIPVRSDNAAKNFAAEYGGRGRFLQQDELATWAEFSRDLDPEKKVLGSPFSGASHMYALHGQPAYLPVAGLSLTTADRNVIRSVPLAAASPAHCQNFLDRDIGYVYQEVRPYQFSPVYSPIDQDASGLGTVLFETDHSRLIEIDCTGSG